jgi:hypothetical protein
MSLVVNPSEAEALRAHAASKRITLSELVRRILLDHAREVSHTSKRVSHTLQCIDALIKPLSLSHVQGSHVSREATRSDPSKSIHLILFRCIGIAHQAQWLIVEVLNEMQTTSWSSLPGLSWESI